MNHEFIKQLKKGEEVGSGEQVKGRPGLSLAQEEMNLKGSNSGKTRIFFYENEEVYFSEMLSLLSPGGKKKKK